MTAEQEKKFKLGKIGPLEICIVSGLVAAAALAGAGYRARAGLELVTAATTSTFIRDYAPVMLGLPVLAALAAAIVCEARALEDRSHIELLGLRAGATSAIITVWAVVFAAFAVDPPRALVTVDDNRRRR